MAPTKAQIVEMKHSRNHEEPKYIALENLNFAWLDEEISQVMRMWHAGKPIWDIAETLKRPQEEILVLLIDLSMKGGLKERAGGIWGSGLRQSAKEGKEDGSLR